MPKPGAFEKREEHEKLEDFYVVKRIFCMAHKKVSTGKRSNNSFLKGEEPRKIDFSGILECKSITPDKSFNVETDQ